MPYSQIFVDFFSSYIVEKYRKCFLNDLHIFIISSHVLVDW